MGLTFRIDTHPADIAGATDRHGEDDETVDGCANDWCDGPTSDTLPCFECFDPSREYDIRGRIEVTEIDTASEADR